LWEEFPDVDHFVLDEGEITFPMFLKDLEKGELKRIYTSDEKPDITKTPIPRWDLIDMKNYNKMPIQFSRGCPFDCEFCNVVALNGKIPRTKTPEQIINELNAIYDRGWDGTIFIVDDNFIGNRPKTIQVLKKIIEWQNSRKERITFMTEVSLNLADDDEMLYLMREAGFDSVFIGLETPSEEALAECGKFQNKNRNLVESVRKLHQSGFEVTAGFIVGFDSDDESIFRRQIEFIQKTGIVVAMIGLLQALPGTRLYKRLQKENRILSHSTGNNTDFSTNFIPKLNYDTLIEGYKSIIAEIYSHQNFYDRIYTFLRDYRHYNSNKFQMSSLIALFKAIWYIGIKEKHRKYYWKLFFTSLFKHTECFAKVMTMSVYYYHFNKIFRDFIENKTVVKKPDAIKNAARI